MSIRAIVVDNSEELLEKITRILREMEDVELCGFIIKPYTRMQIVDMLNRYRCERDARKAL